LADENDIIDSWCYDGNSIPLAGSENPRINFWLLPPAGSPSGTPGAPPSDGQEAEVIIKDFLYLPLPKGDMDNDGIVNFDDLVILARNWLKDI
jgi:hypothetical protein